MKPKSGHISEVLLYLGVWSPRPTLESVITFIVRIITKQWPLAPNSRDLLITRESHFSQKWPLANVSKSGESSQHGLANFGKSGESSQKCLAKVGKSGEYLPSLGKCRPMIR